ncbi:MAG TPA: response regulator transcription factor, partial [Chroococcales cyanobacterium]
YKILAQTENGIETIEQTIALVPDILLVKHNLPEPDGIACTRAIRSALGDQISIVLALTHPSEIWDCLDCGMNGLVLRETRVELLPYALKQVDAGHGWIGPHIAEYLLLGDGLPFLRASGKALNVNLIKNLSDRERAVVRLLVQGASNQAIADSLGLSLQTVKVHIKSILRKLGASTRSEAIVFLLSGGKSI